MISLLNKSTIMVSPQTNCKSKCLRNNNNLKANFKTHSLIKTLWRKAMLYTWMAEMILSLCQPRSKRERKINNKLWRMKKNQSTMMRRNTIRKLPINIKIFHIKDMHKRAYQGKRECNNLQLKRLKLKMKMTEMELLQSQKYKKGLNKVAKIFTIRNRCKLQIDKIDNNSSSSIEDLER